LIRNQFFGRLCHDNVPRNRRVPTIPQKFMVNLTGFRRALERVGFSPPPKRVELCPAIEWPQELSPLGFDYPSAKLSFPDGDLPCARFFSPRS
jgi:hypothetical protein